MTSACILQGLSTEDPWDIRYGERFNVLNRRNRRRLMRLIASGHVFLVWWGTPCTTFSIARYPPLRCRFAVDVPSPGLSAASLALFEEGNALADVTVEGLSVAHLCGIFSIVENPLRSGLWSYPVNVKQLYQRGWARPHWPSVLSHFLCRGLCERH